ncbi:MAG: DUF2784 domain-containing protein [Gemmatimonadetes bacterium]|nr:DUF2784 domain-containing protein [Gemmatimonadota bacterium]
MIYLLLADVLVVLHFAFIVFVALGALTVYRWSKMAWAHIPSALWGAWIEITGGICPLTPLEAHFRRMGGAEGYTGSFIEHYLVPIIYPSGLTQADQLLLGGLVVAVNLSAYGFLLWRRRSARPPGDGEHG